MNLLICLITYNRLGYTQRTLESLKKTIDVPYHLVVVDNDSTDGTLEWLKTQGLHLVQNPENLYPGRACNIGWSMGLLNYPQPTYLMRCDNDMEFAPNWATKAKEYFDAMPKLGQLGLDYTALDTFDGDERFIKTQNGKTINFWPGNVGGPCIIRREVYDAGARYEEEPWHHDNGRPTATEDVKFSWSMHQFGFMFGHATEKLAWTFANPSNWKDYPEYMKKTLLERGFADKYKKVFGDY